jgi:SAM-dependent methyltransferase
VGQQTISKGSRDRRSSVLKQANITELPFEDCAFNFVVSWGVIMHIPEMEKALSELARVVKHSGVLVLCENNLNSLDVAIRERAIHGVKKLMGRNLSEIRDTPRGSESWKESESGGLMVDVTAVSYRDPRVVRVDHGQVGLATRMYDTFSIWNAPSFRGQRARRLRVGSSNSSPEPSRICG